jgi:hypothetical protein
MRLRLPDNALASLPVGTMVNYFEQATWNGSATSVPTATTNFTGWVLSAEYSLAPGVRYAEVEIGGPAEVLRKLGAYTQYLEAATIPATWQQLHANCSAVDYVLWYTILLRAPNLALLFDHHPYSLDHTQYLSGYYKFKAGNLLTQLQGVAGFIACNYGFDSTGAGWVTRHPSLTGEYPARSLARRDILTPARYQSVRWTRRYRPEVRKVRAEGFAGGGIGNPPTAYIAEAPRGVPGQGVGEARLEGLTTISLLNGDDLKGLAGGLYAQVNNPYPAATFEIPGNRDVYEPAKQEPVDFQCTAAQAPDGTAWDKSGVPQRVTKRIGPHGAAHITLELEPETTGADGGIL